MVRQTTSQLEFFPEGYFIWVGWLNSFVVRLHKESCSWQWYAACHRLCDFSNSTTFITIESNSSDQASNHTKKNPNTLIVWHLAMHDINQLPARVERTPDPTRTPKVIGGQNRPEIPKPIECQGPDIKDNCLFHINWDIFFMIAVFMVPEFWKLLADQLIGCNPAYSLT